MRDESHSTNKKGFLYTFMSSTKDGNPPMAMNVKNPET